MMSAANGGEGSMHARTLTVRESNAEDEPAATDVEHLAVADLRKIYRPTSEARRKRRAIASIFRRLVAVVDSRVVGTVKFRVVGDELLFLALGVHPAFRRRG